MAAHSSLVERWQSQLDENERLAASASTHRQWLPRISPKRCIRILCQHGLRAKQIRRGDDTIIMVHAGQREQALELIRENRDQIRAGSRRAQWIRSTSLGTLIGFGLGLPAILACIVVMRLVDRQSGISSDEVRVLIGVAIIFTLCLIASLSPWYRRRGHV